MASGPTTSWHINEGNVEPVADIIFLGSKITLDLDYSQKLKDTFFLEGRKSMKNLYSVLKSRASLCYRNL